MRLLIAALPVFSLAFILTAAGAQAQQSPAAAATQGCDPCISKGASYSRMEDDPAYKIRMKYCAAHPEKCRPPDMRSPENAAIMEKANEAQAVKYPYQKPQPGHDTACFRARKDPPNQWVCIPDTWWPNWPKQPEDGHCYSNPKNPSELRCVPTREQQMQAEGSP